MAAVATVLMLSVTGSANAWENHGGCNYGEALGKGATALNTFEFNLCQRSANIKDVYGDFMATAPVQATILAPRGPITCADIKGKEVGFYYPFDAKSIPPGNPVVTGLMIYALDGGAKGAGDKIGFAPVIAGANADCSLTSPTVMGAKATAQPLTTGDITITQKGATMTKSANSFVP